MLSRVVPALVLVIALAVVGLLYAGVSNSANPHTEPIELHAPRSSSGETISNEDQQPSAATSPSTSPGEAEVEDE